MTHRRAQLHDRGHAEDLRVATGAGPQSIGHTTGVGDDGQPGYGVLPMPGPKRPSLGRGSTGLPPSSCARSPRRSSAGAHDRRAPPGPRPSRGPAAPQADRQWSVVPDGQVGGQDLGQVTPLGEEDGRGLSAVMATLLLPSIARWSVTFVAYGPMTAARSSLPRRDARVQTSHGLVTSSHPRSHCDCRDRRPDLPWRQGQYRP